MQGFTLASDIGHLTDKKPECLLKFHKGGQMSYWIQKLPVSNLLCFWSFFWAFWNHSTKFKCTFFLNLYLSFSLTLSISFPLPLSIHLYLRFSYVSAYRLRHRGRVSYWLSKYPIDFMKFQIFVLLGLLRMWNPGFYFYYLIIIGSKRKSKN